MSTASRTKTVYIEPHHITEKPSYTLSSLAASVADAAKLHDILSYGGINSRPGPNRRKVKITITVEDAA